MRIAQARGDGDGVLRAYRGCEPAMAELGTAPAQSTTALLDGLRG
jgi:hypothetical protein